MTLFSRDGDQYILRGPDGLLAPSLDRLPWGGRSPRALTRCSERAIFKAQAEKSVSDFVSDENQHDLWLTIKKAPWRRQGAPLLVEPRRT